ncbi:MAG: hypothetical protein JXD23_11370 [Spirochaetales bacterium]|nr:hypothetical protein [Spirochaetales bacterium]
MMRLRWLVFSFFYLCASGLWAQNQSSGVFAPFVSRLAAVPQAGRIVLSWKNSEDASGYKQVFRSDVEITDRTFGSATMIARVAPNVESHLDTPPSGHDYFYAVLLEDNRGDLYRVFIPYRNQTAAGVRLAQSAESAAASVTGITASVAGETVMVSFLPSNKTRDLIFYRSTAPIRSVADLTKASYSILLSPGTLQVKDVPLPGIDYYYAVLDADLVNSGASVFVTGQNTTASPVQIPLGDLSAKNRAPVERVFPLPAPHVLYSIESGEELLPPLPFLLPQKMELAGAVQNRIDSLIGRIQRPPKEMTFELLPVDEASNLEGEDLLLQTIVKASSEDPGTKETVDKIGDFLRTAHGDRIEARARFYLGQAYYLHGQVREALLQFVLAQRYYYVETQKWVDACLSSLETAK